MSRLKSIAKSASRVFRIAGERTAAQVTDTTTAPAEPTAPAVAAPTHDQIRERAYRKWEAAGWPAGDGVEFWLEAERELNGG